MLYPLKFKPIFKDKIWGGKKIKTILNKNFGKLTNCGESWEISAIQKNISKVSNGILQGNDLQDLIEVYMGDLVGEKVYNQFGIEFPLLIKFIDASEVLSIQVHPNDKLAMERHKAYGKTEMWYIIQADQNAEIILGFNEEADKLKYEEHLTNNTIQNILNVEQVKSGDVFFIPAGRVHAIGAGILLAEIQQTSDVTYRIFDWNRTDDAGKPRDLHTELAIDAIDFKHYIDYKTQYISEINKTSNIVTCRYFTTNIIQFNEIIVKDYNDLDSFIIYMCFEGNYDIHYEGGDPVNIKKGETVLIPAILKEIKLVPFEQSKILEVFIA